MTTTDSSLPENCEISQISATSAPPDITALLSAGRRLAAALPLCDQQNGPHPISRFASRFIARAEVRRCLAALSGAGADQLSALRQRLSGAIRAINSAPDDSTARRLFDSPQVQELLWSWSAAEASKMIRNLTRSYAVDDDKFSDLIGDAVMGFLREQSQRIGHEKLSPFKMARNWDANRMPDPLGTLRAYLHAWCKNSAQKYIRQETNEVSLDAPVGGAGGDANGQTLGDSLVDKSGSGDPQNTLMCPNDHRTQVQSMARSFQNQIAGLEADIESLAGKTDAYASNQRVTLQNRLAAIREMVAPLLDRLRKASDAISAVESNRAIDPGTRAQQLRVLQADFDAAMSNLSAISDAQERAHGTRITREEQSVDALRQRQDGSEQRPGEPASDAMMPSAQISVLPKSKKIVADPLSAQHAYQRAQENAERLLPHVYRSLTHRKTSDLSQRYTAGLFSNARLLDGINNQKDLAAAVSSDPAVRSTANDRALFSTTALRTMMVLRDQYTHDEKYSVLRNQGEVPKKANQRFIQMMGAAIEGDPVLTAHAPQILDLLKEFISGWHFRALWDSVDHIARTGAYEMVRNEQVGKRWSELTPDDINTVADGAEKMLYDNYHRPFGARSLTDVQNRVTHDLDLTPQERQEIMRGEVGRIRGMLSGEIQRGPWAHGEPADSKRFHDRLRPSSPVPPATQPVPVDPTNNTAQVVTHIRRFASAGVN